MRLLNVLIVDDEPFVVDWLSSLLEAQTELSLDIYRTYNAAEAIEKLEHIRVDIMIADIKMPDMDGLHLARFAIRNWAACKVMLLTAHTDFTYVHDAINQGIVSYILKTQTDEHILKELKRIIGLIEQEVNQTLLLEDIRRDRDAYHYQLQRYAFFNWLQNEKGPFALAKYVGMLGFKGEGIQYCLLVGEMKTEDSATVPADESMFFQVKVVMLRYLREYIAHYAMELDNRHMLWVLQPRPDCASRFSLLLRGLLEPVQQFCLDNYNMMISFLLSGLTTMPLDIANAYTASKRLLQRMRTNKSGYIYTYTIDDALDITNRKDDDTCIPLYTAPYVKQIKAALENGQQEACLYALARICAGLRTCTEWQDSTALETYFSVALVFLHDINHRKQRPADVCQLLQPWRHADWADACANLEKLCNQLFDLQESDKQQNIHHIIQTVEEYISQHICEDISLTVLSDVVGYNASYLSRFYSEKTGSTISDYIARQKLRLIDCLMREPALSLNQITEQTGFRSRTYFNNYIKRITGISPQKYRDNLLGQPAQPVRDNT